MIFRLIDSRIILEIPRRCAHASISEIRPPRYRRSIATDGRIAPRDSIRVAANGGRVSAIPIDEKDGRLPIAAIAENVINAHGFADRER
jgi:hypothetical protein